jgi:2-oxoglutarate dehydrogenase E2 component (dihydrolipoamide succinyltransferase)
MIVQLKVPEVGESIQEVIISQWLKQEGQWVERDEEAVEIDSEKASLPIPAPSAGRIVKILKRDGETVAVGDVIAEIDDAAEQDEDREEPEEAHKEQTTMQSKPPAVSQSSATNDSPDPTTDEVRKKTGQVATTTRVEAPVVPKSRISSRKKPENEPENEHNSQPERPSLTERAESRTMKPQPAVQKATEAREEEIVPMSAIRRRIAARLVEAQQNSALLTTFNEIDMSAVIELRSKFGPSFQQEHGVKLGFMSFFVKAAIEALARFPEVNAEIRGNDIVFHNYYDIGIAIGVDRGLVVPVLRNADRLSFAEVESSIDDFAKRAASDKLQPKELTGGTFTISNGGIYGSLLSTPIVNPPQSGVLGMHTIQERPVAREGQVVIRPMMYIALSYDHRLVDGREAVGFLSRVKELIEQPSRILLEA